MFFAPFNQLKAPSLGPLTSPPLPNFYLVPQTRMLVALIMAKSGLALNQPNY